MTRLKIAAKALALGALLASAATAQPRPSVITNADWLRKPTAEDMAHNYPQAATMLNLAGRVVMHCVVDASGHLEDCEIPEEAPRGFGFGKAALALGRGFLMRPQTRDGAAVSGGKVNIPIVFRLPAGQPPPELPTPTPKSPQALAAAVKFVAAAKTTDRAAQNYEQWATAFDGGRVADVSPENSAVIAKAIRTTYPIRLQEVADRQARLYASLFTPKELAELEAFYETKAAAVVYGQAEGAQAIAAAQAVRNRLRQAAVSREIFCASHSCEPDAPPADDRDTPQWAHMPTIDQVRRNRPELAGAFNLPGSAQLTCTVIVQGGLSGCRIARETPTELGFGRAALTLAGFYSLDPTAPKAAAIGQTVSFEVRFDALPEVPTQAETTVAPRSPGSLAMARELLAAINPPVASPTALQRQRAAAQGVTSANWTPIFDVMDQAYLKVRDEMLDQRASWLTTQLTDTELLAALKIWRGPLAAKWRAHNEELALATQKAASGVNVRVWADVGKAFCAAQACYTPPPLPAIAASPAASTRTP